ncbi:lipase/acyltransferase domain-containing protein [Nonomuraea bangladeshensis]|uniref:lipase/acyltransferase domain-containing protein n=1 Tax=Nonomuraea bangladeshensis TaxID=404385 RepID=UPI003C2E360E
MIVIPGIMGSELVDTESGRVLWGLSDLQWYVSAWTSGASLAMLQLSADERMGRYGRIRATRLIRFPAFVPVLSGLMPYRSLIKGLHAVVRHRDAVAEFAYDWRLPVAHNAALLTEFAMRHLDAWQAHPAYVAGRADLSGPDSDPFPRLVLVAHSMGGLLAWLACQDTDLTRRVRTTVTLGTPFFGAPKAVLLFGAGGGVPLPRHRARQLMLTLPGVYDLLPAYRCVTDGSSARRLDISDISSLGGDSELAAESLALSEARPLLPPAGHVQVVGAHQPTVQAVTIKNGAVTAHQFTYRPDQGGVTRVDTGGDSTVPRESAQLPPGPAIPLAQSHGAVAATAEAVLVTQDALLDRRTGPWLGAGEIGLDAPDIVRAGRTFWFGVTGVRLPTDVRCTVVDLGTGLRVDTPAARWRDGAVVAEGTPLPPGLYQIRVDGGGASPVTQMLLSADLPDDAYGGADRPNGTR